MNIAVTPTGYLKCNLGVLFATVSVMSDDQLSDNAATRVQANPLVCPFRDDS